MKILVLPRYSNLGASSRIRFLQFTEKLEETGFTLFTFPFFQNNYIKNLEKNKKNFLQIIYSYLLRFKILFMINKFDLIWLEKEFFPYFPSFLESIIFKLGPKVIVDYDDAVFHNFDTSNFLIKLVLKKKYDKIMQYSHSVISGNEYINARSKINNKNSYIIPSVVQYEKYFSNALIHTNNDKIVIGWIGSRATTNYLLIIKEVINIIKKKYANVEFLCIGASHIDNLDIHVVPWSDSNEVKLLNDIDIGIMPLLDNNFERGKCGFKLIQYMACGKPVIASKVGVNSTIVDNNINGFLVTTEKEWIEKLELLINNVKLRIELGSNAKQKALNFYNTQKVYPVLENIFLKELNPEMLDSFKEFKILNKSKLSPFVSVVIPFYNNEKTLKYSLISIINQSYNNIEIILINDGSTDNSVNTIKEYLKLKNVSLYDFKENRGLVYRLNQMTQLTQCEYIARMDADDISHKERILKQMFEFHKNKKLNIVSTGCAILDSNFQVRGIRDVFGQPTIVDFFKYGGLIHASIIFKRELLIKFKYNKDYYRAEDRELFLRIFSSLNFIRINEPLYFVQEYGRLNYDHMIKGYLSEGRAIFKYIFKYFNFFKSIYFILRYFIKFIIFIFLGKIGYTKLLFKKSGGLYFYKFKFIQKMINSIISL